MPKPAILDVIAAQKARYSVRELLNAAYAQEPTERAALFKIVADIADESSIGDLVSRIEGKDPVARLHIIQVLGRFNTPVVQQAVQRQLKDNNKLVRSAALTALARMDGPFDMPLITGMLRDAEIEVQNKAVDVVVKANHPDTVKFLVEVLKDENEYARRAAVEVLNVIGSAKDVKYLLEVIADSDWWVRTRAADALGKIGGPKVVDAVLTLIKDENQDIRRAAIEILNQTKDERAIGQLIEATKDKDWWVSERAVDALAEIGSVKALPRFIEMLQGEPKSLPTVVRAIAKVGDQKNIEHLIPMLQRPENEVKLEAIAAMAKLVDERRADTVRIRLQALSQGGDGTIVQAVARAMTEIETRFSTQQIAANQRALQMQEPSKTLLVDNQEIAAVIKETEASAAVNAKLDIATLKPGDVIEGRYKFIEKIGKGAFGTVLLMEDTVVEERLILKFLNANVSSDEEMMKRFVHELRYSRKITHKNVIRIYDFLYIQGNYAISMEYFPSHTLGGEIINEKPVELKRAVKFGIDIATGMASRASSRHRAPRLEAGQRADRQRQPAEDRGLRRGGRPNPGRYAAHQDGLRDRLAEIHGARADPRQEGGRARGHLQPRSHLVRAVHRGAALLAGRSHVRDVPACAGQGAPAHRDQQGAAGRAQQPRSEMHVARQDQARAVHGRAADLPGKIPVALVSSACRSGTLRRSSRLWRLAAD